MITPMVGSMTAVVTRWPSSSYYRVLIEAETASSGIADGELVVGGWLDRITRRDCDLTSGYSLTLLDEQGVDLLGGQGAALVTSTSAQVLVPYSGQSGGRILMGGLNGRVRLRVTGAGATKRLGLCLWLMQ